jgi:hypothetical protein
MEPGLPAIQVKCLIMYWKPDPELYPPYLRSLIAEGRGIRTGPFYKGFFKIPDLPSDGTSHKIPGIKTRRRHYLLSDNEAIYFYLQERKRNVTDIRENFPIYDIDWTFAACKRLGIRHSHNEEGYPKPFTIDFIITERFEVELSERAASLKTPEDSKDPDKRTRLKVERHWCTQRAHIPWTLVDTTSFQSKEMLSVLLFMRGWFLQRYVPDELFGRRFLDAFWKVYEKNVPLHELILPISRKLRTSEDVAMNAFRYCAWDDQIPVSLQSPLDADGPVILRENYAQVQSPE